MGINALALQCHSLQELCVYQNETITSGSLCVLVKNCPHLRDIQVGMLDNVDDVVLYAVSLYCPLLSKVEIFECPLITDNGVCVLVKKCRLLTNIQLHTGITDRSLLDIAQYSTKLHTLDVRDCSDVTEQRVITVVEGCNELRVLLVKDGLLTEDTKLYLKVVYPLLTFEHVW